MKRTLRGAWTPVGRRDLWGAACLLLLAACGPGEGGAGGDGAAPTALVPFPDAGQWTPALRLFDLAPTVVEAGLDDLSAEARAALAQDEIDIADERIGSDSFVLQTARFADLGFWIYERLPRFPCASESRLVRVEDLGDPRAGQPTKMRVPREPGWAVIGPDGLFVATGSADQKPPPVSLSYRTFSSAIEREMLSPPVGPGGLPLTSAMQLTHETRRSALVGTSSRLAWDLDVPAGAVLDLGLGANSFGFVLGERGLTHSLDAIGFCDMLVELRAAGPAEPAPPVDVLFTKRMQRGQAGRFHDARIDLSAYAGQRVQIALVTRWLGSAEKRRPIFPLWAEPVLAVQNATAPPNMLVLMLDTLRADRLGCYGWERAQTPHLDRLAGEGVRFAQASSGAPWTLPAHATLFTSLHVSQHGLWRKDHRLPESALTLAEVLGDHGYRTAAYSEGGFVRPIYGLAQGFERFEAEPRDARETFAAALEWVSDASGPWFAFVQTYSVHSPYDPPDPFRQELVRPYTGPLPAAVSPPEYPWGRNLENNLSADDERYLQDLYDAEIAYLDHAVGEFVRALEQRDLLENTVLLVTSDHGEEFGDHGHFEHGFSLYQEQLHVPLIVRYPGRFEGGAVVEHPVQAIDVAPTLALLAGAAVPAAWTGVPLSLDPPESPRPVFVPFFTRQSGEPCAALRLGAQKYIEYPMDLRPADRNGPVALFELSADPGEHQSLLEPQLASRWKQAVEDLWRRYEPLIEAESSSLSPELHAELKALGYLDGGN